MKRAAILARVSTWKQVEGHGLTRQVECCKAKARELGYVVDPDDIYLEKAVSRDLDLLDRKILLQVLQSIQDGRYQALIVEAQDRLTSNSEVNRVIRRTLAGAGAELIWGSEVEEEFNKRLLDFIAQYKEDVLRERVESQ